MNWWQILAVAVRVIQKDAEEKKSSFNPRPYFRLFLNWILDLGSPDPVFDGANFQVQLHVLSPPSSLKPCPTYLGCPLWFFPYLHWIIMLASLTTFRSWRLLRMLSMHCSLWKFLVGGQHAAFAFFPCYLSLTCCFHNWILEINGYCSYFLIFKLVWILD